MTNIIKLYKNLFLSSAVMFLLFCNFSAQPNNFTYQHYSTDLYKTIFADNYPANVDRLNLSQGVIFVNCKKSESRCSENKEKIDIWTEASDPHGDVLIYQYKVSGGEIVGNGKKVIWDLSDAEPGEYTITAGVDDGCGICGQTKTRTVYVIECPNLSRKESGKHIEDYSAGVIHSVSLDQPEIFEFCSLSVKKERFSCMDDYKFVKVSTHSIGVSAPRSIYKYEVSGGQIVGNGENIEWDLTKVKPGNYTVTVSVDIGNGFCSEPRTAVVRVVECTRCKKTK